MHTKGAGLILLNGHSYGFGSYKFSFLLICLALLGQAIPVSAETAVKVYLDKSSAGWAYKNSDYAFVVEQQDCTIQWNAVEDKQGKRSLSVRRDCPRPFADQVVLHRAILAEINRRWPIKNFKTIYWGMFCQQHDNDWCVPVAKASLTSTDYIDYWRNYPDSRVKSSNRLFVQLANQTNAYQPLTKLFGEFGVVIKLDSVEKVFSERLQKSSLYEQLRDFAPPGNPRVMVNVGMAYFEITQ